MNSSSSGRPVTFDTMGTIKNFIDSLELPEHEVPSVLIIESIANSIDSKAKNIDMQLIKRGVDGYVFKIIDDGEGMSRRVFEESYHKFSSSSKPKGEGIGFAGVGAKLCFYLSSTTRVKTTTIGPDGPLCSLMWWNDRDKEIKWDYSDQAAVEPSDLNKLRMHGRGTIYEVEIDYRTYNYLWNNYGRVVRKWYNAVLLGLYPGAISFNSIPIEPEKFEAEKETERTIRVAGEKFSCFFYLLKEDLPEDKEEIIGINFIVFGKYIKTDNLDWGGRIKPSFQKKVYAVVKADQLAKYLNFNKKGFNPGSKLYGTVRREVEKEFSNWLGSIGALRVEDEILPPSKELSRLGEVLQSLLRKEKYRAFNPFIKQVSQSVLVKSKTGELQGNLSDGSQLTTGTFGGEGKGGGTRVGGEGEGKSPVQDKGDIRIEKKEREVRSFVIGEKAAKDDPREAWVDPTTQFLLVNTSHPFYIAARSGNTDIKWMQLIKAVVDAMAYYKADEIFNNDYKKGSELKQDLYREAWEGLRT
ncbi:MAG: ATP-binding protein [Candidatus Parvarchaeota archaeon]